MSRLWIDRLGVRMDEPRDRYHITSDQVMTSVEYTGELQPELIEFREALGYYFEYCKECRFAVGQETGLPDMPPELVKYLTRKEVKNARKKASSAAKAPTSEAQQDS